jgi:hypothetical protein
LSSWSSCFSLLNTGIVGMNHHAWLGCLLWQRNSLLGVKITEENTSSDHDKTKPKVFHTQLKRGTLFYQKGACIYTCPHMNRSVQKSHLPWSKKPPSPVCIKKKKPLPLKVAISPALYFVFCFWDRISLTFLG